MTVPTIPAAISATAIATEFGRSLAPFKLSNHYPDPDTSLHPGGAGTIIRFSDFSGQSAGAPAVNFPGSIPPANNEVEFEDSFPANSAAYITFDSNGGYFDNNSHGVGLFPAYSAWLVTPGVGLGAQFEIRCTILAGLNNHPLASPAGVWLSLSSARSFGTQRAAVLGATRLRALIEIRVQATGVVVAGENWRIGALVTP